MTLEVSPPNVQPKSVPLSHPTAGRVLVACGWFPPAVNGMAGAVWQHVRGLIGFGYEVDVATTVNSESSFPTVPGLNVHGFAIRGNGRLGNPFRGAVNAYQDFLRNYQGEVAFFHGWESWPSELAVPVLNAMTARSVLVSHGTSYHWRPPGLQGWLRWLAYRPYAWEASQKIRCFDEYVFLSDLAERIRHNDRLLAEKLGLTNWRVIPNGANPLLLTDEPGPSESFRQRHGLRGRRLLLCVSNYLKTKGQRELVEAFLAAPLPDNPALVLVGHEVNAFSEALARRAGAALNRSVYVLAHLSQADIRAAYREADLFVTATYTEAQPLMLLDAMAAGLPFLAPPVGSIPELSGGLLYRNQTEFRQHLTALLTDEILRATLSEQGRRAVADRYNWSAVVARYHQLIQEVHPVVP